MATAVASTAQHADPFDAAAAAGLVCVDPCWQAILPRLMAFARTDHPVALLGPTGVGKSSFARFIHAMSRRADRAWTVVECSQLTDEHGHSDLFGHLRGAFTGALQSRKGFFEQADGGTVFFDEFADLEVALQGRLLRAIQERTFRPLGGERDLEVDVRFVVATNRPLTELRDDLRYRVLSLVERIPPLCERPGDIEPLARHILTQLNERHRGWGLPAVELSDDALAWLHTYDWPGNVRELERALEMASTLAAARPDATLEPNDLDHYLMMAVPGADALDLGGRSTRRPTPATQTRSADARLSDNAHAVIEALADAPDGLQREDFMERTGMSQATLYRALGELTEGAHFEKVKQGKAVVYVSAAE